MNDNQRKPKRKNFLKILIIVVAILVMINLIVFGLAKLKDKEITKSEDSSEESTQTDLPTVKVSAVGDVIAHDSLNANAYDEATDTYDYTQFISEISATWQDRDLVYANLESMTDENYSVTGYPAFNAPTDLIDSLAESGINTLSLANNHSVDVSNASPMMTQRYLDENYADEIYSAGVSDNCDDFSFETYSLNGIEITYTSIATLINVPENIENCNINLASDPNFEANLKELTATGDVNIVALHFGEEGVSTTSSEEEELVQKLLDNGVEIILGTHPHVLKPIKETTNSEGHESLVAYSLGNFLHTQLEPDERLGGILNFDLVKDEQVSIKNIQFIPTYMYYTWGTIDVLETRTNLEVIKLDDLKEIDSNLYEEESAILSNAIDEKYLNEIEEENEKASNADKTTFIAEEPYTNIEEITDPAAIEVLVNKNKILPSDYVPEDLIIPNVAESTRTSSDVHYIRKDIEKNIIDLFNGAADAGYNLVFVSGYRSYATQESLYNSYVNSSGVAEADKYSARPGSSEHQTGLSFDISAENVDSQGVDAFTDTPESKWIEENAHKYGFIVRYPEAKEEITGYQYESWHLRYIGVDAATEIYEDDLTLEEYLN